MPDARNYRALQSPDFSRPEKAKESTYRESFLSEEENAPSQNLENNNLQPIIINPAANHYQHTEVVEENLSLEDMEKDLIQKALKKHKNRRKDAAEELGISERTLYRKIKYYNL